MSENSSLDNLSPRDLKKNKPLRLEEVDRKLFEVPDDQADTFRMVFRSLPEDASIPLKIQNKKKIRWEGDPSDECLKAFTALPEPVQHEINTAFFACKRAGIEKIGELREAFNKNRPIPNQVIHLPQRKTLNWLFIPPETKD